MILGGEIGQQVPDHGLLVVGGDDDPKPPGPLPHRRRLLVAPSRQRRHQVPEDQCQEESFGAVQKAS
jgi:hypothetical protein